MTDEIPEAPPDSKRQRNAAFRPLLIWIGVSVILLAWDFHKKGAARTRIAFEVLVEGQPVRDNRAYTATVGNLRVIPGSIIPIGWRTFHITLPDAEPVQRSLSIWYGPNDIGSVDLEWMRGQLDLQIEPKVKEVHLVGPHYSFSLTNSTGTSVSIPVGTYRVTSIFEHFSDERQISVSRDGPHRVLIKPPAATIRLSSDPSEGQFRLIGAGQRRLRVEGRVPTEIEALPPGKYELQVWRGDYVKTREITLIAGDNTEIKTTFDYGHVKLTSEPSGAKVFLENKEIGATPKTVTELKPGSYRFRLTLDDFHPTGFDVEIHGGDSVSLSTNLLSLRFTAAIEFAERQLRSRSPDYSTALVGLENALKERPGDPDALALKTRLEEGFASLQAKTAEKMKLQAIAAKKKLAADSFESLTSPYRNANLFDTHSWVVTSDLKSVRDAVLRTVGETTIPWNIDRENQVNEETLIFFGKPKGIVSLERLCVILISEIQPGETHVYAKFWDYQVGKNVTISLFRGITPDSLIPIHRNYFPASQAKAVEERRAALADNFHTILLSELR